MRGETTGKPLKYAGNGDFRRGAEARIINNLEMRMRRRRSALFSRPRGRTTAAALLGECPENDCTIYRNVFRMAVDVDGQMGKLTGHARETMQREYDRLLRELNHLYTMNHAVKKYREAQHDRT